MTTDRTTDRSPRDVYCDVQGCNERLHLRMRSACPPHDLLYQAAPKLYEALKRIVALSEDDEHEPTYAWKDAFEAGAAALAIAEGEAH